MSSRLLIVDDTKIVRDYLTFVFGRAGFEVATVPSGTMALEWLNSHTADIMLLDVMMPGMDGLELCRRLRADSVTARTPIVVYSAVMGAELRAKVMAAGADEFLDKTIHHNELVQRVSTWLAASASPGGIGEPDLVTVGLDLMPMLESDLVCFLAQSATGYSCAAVACKQGEIEAQRFLSRLAPGLGGEVWPGFRPMLDVERPRFDMSLSELELIPDGYAIRSAFRALDVRAISIIPLGGVDLKRGVLLYSLPRTLNGQSSALPALSAALRYAHSAWLAQLPERQPVLNLPS